MMGSEINVTEALTCEGITIDGSPP